jgi:ABC-type phosphate transport system substrate-binding protein
VGARGGDATGRCALARGRRRPRHRHQNNSGTYAYFREAVLGREGNYKLGSLDMHGSKDVVDLVEKTPGAIGYSGLAYATDHPRTTRSS